MTSKTINIILGILTVMAFSFIQIIYNHSFRWAFIYENSIFSAFADLFYQFLTWNFKIVFFPEQNTFLCVYFFLCVCLLISSFLNKKIYIIISIFSLYVFWYAIIYVFGSYIGDFEMTSIPFFIISIFYILALFKQKIIIIAFLLGIFDYFVYKVFLLLLWNYEYYYHEGKGEYWSLASMTTFQKSVYISFHIWHIINIFVLVFVLYKVGKAVFNYFEKNEKMKVFTLKNGLITILFVAIEYLVYGFFTLAIMNDDAFGTIPKSEYWNLASSPHSQSLKYNKRVTYILLDIWNFINITLLIFIFYKVGKAVFNYFNRNKNS